MLFADLTLARRLEFHEAWSSVEHARVTVQLYPATGATTLPVAGGHAVFCGARSPLSQVYAAGLSGPVRAPDLEALEAFYRQRGCGVRVRVCPLVDRSLLQLLGARGYSVQDFMNVYAWRVSAAEDVAAAVAGLQIGVASPDQARGWFEQLGVAGDWAEPDGVAFMTIRCALKAGARLFLAWHDGRPIGGGALEIHDGLAALMAAETLPAFRNQGVQTALLRARLAAAAAAGCDLALVHTRPGAASQRNVQRAGFQLVYTTAELVSPPAVIPQT